MKLRFAILFGFGILLFVFASCGTKNDGPTVTVIGGDDDDDYQIPAPKNRPIASVNPVTTVVSRGDSIVLDGNFSRDPDCDFLMPGESCSELIYEWVKIRGPASLATQAADDNSKLKVTAGQDPGVLHYVLLVGKQWAGEVYYGLPATAYIMINDPPVLTTDREFIEATAGGEVTMTVSATDIDNDALEFSWKQILGPRAEIEATSYDDRLVIKFTPVYYVGQTYKFSFTVSDGSNSTQPQVVDVQVFRQADNNIYVAPNAHINNSNGSRARPYTSATFETALDRAVTEGKDLILADGIILSSLQLGGLNYPIGIFGGFIYDSWERSPGKGYTLFAGDALIDGINVAASVTDSDYPVTIDGISFQVEDNSGPSGRAVIYAKNSASLKIVGCNLDAGDFSSGDSYGVYASDLKNTDAFTAYNNFIYAGDGDSSTGIFVEKSEAEIHFNTIVSGASVTSAEGLHFGDSATGRIHSNLYDLSSSPADSIAISMNDARSDIDAPSPGLTVGGTSNVYGAVSCINSRAGSWAGLYGCTGISNRNIWNTVFYEDLHLAPPCFVDKSAGDYHFSDVCYGITGEGANNIPGVDPLNLRDIDGDPRGVRDPFGGFDIGADEFREETTP